MKKRPGQLPKVNKKIVTCYVWDILSKIDFKSNPMLQSCHPKSWTGATGKGRVVVGTGAGELGVSPQTGSCGYAGGIPKPGGGAGVAPNPWE